MTRVASGLAYTRVAIPNGHFRPRVMGIRAALASCTAQQVRTTLQVQYTHFAAEASSEPQALEAYVSVELRQRRRS